MLYYHTCIYSSLQFKTFHPPKNLTYLSIFILSLYRFALNLIKPGWQGFDRRTRLHPYIIFHFAQFSFHFFYLRFTPKKHKRKSVHKTMSLLFWGEWLSCLLALFFWFFFLLKGKVEGGVAWVCPTSFLSSFFWTSTTFTGT